MCRHAKPAICTDAVITPFHALTDAARLSPGESVVVIGAGGLGLHAVQIAKLAGAAPVIAVDNRAAQLERAGQGGADVVVDPVEQSVVDSVLTATAGVGVDVAAEFVGTRATIGQAVECLRVGGRAVVVGLGAEPITVVPPTVFVRKQLQLLGSHGGSSATLQRVLRLVGTGRLDLSRSITHCFALDDADAALRTVHEKIGDLSESSSPWSDHTTGPLDQPRLGELPLASVVPVCRPGAHAAVLVRGAPDAARISR